MGHLKFEILKKKDPSTFFKIICSIMHGVITDKRNIVVKLSLLIAKLVLILRAPKYCRFVITTGITEIHSDQ